MTCDAKRQIRIFGDVAYIPLTQGYDAIVDLDDLHLVSHFNWRVHIDGKTEYAISRQKVEGKRVLEIKMHRVLMGAQRGQLVDHINGNGLDNRRSNLRFATQAQNQWNQKLHARNTSGVKGVCWNKAKKKWQASLMANGRRIFIGRFEKIEDAAAAYVEANKKHHGEFGRVEKCGE